MNNLNQCSLTRGNPEANNRKTLVVSSNYAWTIYNFRLPLIRKLRQIGYKVIVITQFDGYESKLKSEVDDVLPLFISRKGINPFIDCLTFLHFVRYFLKIKPDYFLSFTIKPVIYGSIAAKFFNIKSIVMITGLGTSFITKNWLTFFVKLLYKFSLSSVATVFFQNNDDKNVFLKNKLVDHKICKQTPGSGIDLNEFLPAPQPQNTKFIFLLIARMILDKGISEFVAAAKIIISKYPYTKFQLLGPLGVENRTSISYQTIKNWEQKGFIEYIEQTIDVKPYIKAASCVVLPSYREGTSRVLLEAASMSRPIITTDVPGCREVVEDGVNGFLCKPKDHHDLSKKMEAIISLSFHDLKNMGKRGRAKIENEFKQEIVIDLFIDAIEK